MRKIILILLFIVGCSGAETPDDLVNSIKVAIASQDEDALKELFIYDEGAEALTYFFGKDVVMTSVSPAIGDNNQCTIVPTDQLQTKMNGAICEFYFTKGNTQSTAFVSLFKKGKWKLQYLSVLYIDGCDINRSSFAVLDDGFVFGRCPNNMKSVKVMHKGSQICSVDVISELDQFTNESYHRASCDLSDYRASSQFDDQLYFDLVFDTDSGEKHGFYHGNVE